MSKSPRNPLQPGQRFGRLTVVEFAGRDKKCYRQYYRCRCDCGNETTVAKSSLTSGTTKSCGCLRGLVGPLQPGQRFGRLTVVKYAGYDKYGNQLYRCRCDCGNKTTVYKGSLLSGNTASCGCLFIDQIPVRFGLQDRTCVSKMRLNRPTKVNTTGVRGVNWDKTNGSFVACLQFQGKKYRQTGFKTVAEAAKARQRMYDEIVQPYLDSLDAKGNTASRGGAAE